MTAEEVKAEIMRRAWSFGVYVLLLPEEYIVYEGEKCRGLFDETIPSIQVATKRDDDDVLGVLLHEYSHLTQWAENCHAWQAHVKTAGMWDWLNGKPLRNASYVIDLTQEIEADCERRTMRLIKELNAPIDIALYAKKSNAYIHFHNVIKDHRKWAKFAGALNQPEILAHCNDTIDTNYKKTPKALYNALVKYAI